MPVYEYHCQACGHRFSYLFRTLQAAEEGKGPPCPACGAKGAQRLISRVAVVGGDSGDAGGEREESASERKPELFGRKELEQTLKDRGY